MFSTFNIYQMQVIFLTMIFFQCNEASMVQPCSVSFASLDKPALGRIQDFKRFEIRIALPVGLSGGECPWKIFKIGVLGNGISAI